MSYKFSSFVKIIMMSKICENPKLLLITELVSAIIQKPDEKSRVVRSREPGKISGVQTTYKLLKNA